MTHIIFVLDRSGSMESVKEATIQGFNSFIKEQKAIDKPARFTLVQFDNEYEMHHDRVSLKRIPELTAITFIPRGGTALLDAVGRTINANKHTADKVVFIILTDGQENASKEFTMAQINDMISERRRAGWEFTFLGANQDAIASAAKIGIASGSAITYNTNKVATQNVFAAVSNSLSSNRVSGRSMQYSEQDRVDAAV